MRRLFGLVLAIGSISIFGMQGVASATSPSKGLQALHACSGEKSITCFSSLDMRLTTLFTKENREEVVREAGQLKGEFQIAQKKKRKKKRKVRKSKKRQTRANRARAAEKRRLRRTRGLTPGILASAKKVRGSCRSVKHNMIRKACWNLRGIQDARKGSNCRIKQRQRRAACHRERASIIKAKATKALSAYAKARANRARAARARAKKSKKRRVRRVRSSKKRGVIRKSKKRQTRANRRRAAKARARRAKKRVSRKSRRSSRQEVRDRKRAERACRRLFKKDRGQLARKRRDCVRKFLRAKKR